MKSSGYDIINFLDDFGGADTPDRAHRAYQNLGLLLQTLNLRESEEKSLPPSTKMIFLGIELNSLTLH